MSCFMVSSVLIKKSAIMVLLFPYCNVSFFSSSFKIFSFPLAFSSLTMMCLCVVFLFSYLGFVELLEFIDCFPSNFAYFLPVFTYYFFLFFKFLSSPADTPIILNVGMFDGIGTFDGSSLRRC